MNVLVMEDFPFKRILYLTHDFLFAFWTFFDKFWIDFDNGEEICNMTENLFVGEISDK